MDMSLSHQVSSAYILAISRSDLDGGPYCGMGLPAESAAKLSRRWRSRDILSGECLPRTPRNKKRGKVDGKWRYSGGKWREY